MVNSIYIELKVIKREMLLSAELILYTGFLGTI